MRVAVPVKPGWYIAYTDVPERPATKGGRAIAHQARFETQEAAQAYIDSMNAAGWLHPVHSPEA